MADFNEIANTATEVQLGGKTLKVRRVSLDTIFGKAETAVISEQMKHIREMANEMEGNDKTSFLAKAMTELPAGGELSKKALDYLKSPSGVKMVLIDALKKDQPNIERELDISSLVTEDADNMTSIIQYVTGRSGKKPIAPFLQVQ